MSKAISLISIFALVIAAAAAQEVSSGESNAQPEPYAYAYQTDSSSASEQRSPDGKVTGYYTLVDPADGRERRVEYVADENGFRAKVATNELGTKSENSADVEVLASPPTEAQLVYQAPPPQQQQYASKQQVVTSYTQVPQQQQQLYTAYSQQQVPRVTTTSYATQQAAVAPVAPVSTTTVVKQQRVVEQQAAVPGVQRTQYAYVQQPAVYGYGYYPGYGYQAYGSNQNAAYGGYGVTGVTGVTNGANYNYHTPAQYYSSGVQKYVTSNQVVQPATYTVGTTGGQNVVSRYVSTTSRTVPVSGGSTYTTYSAAPAVTASRTVTTSSSSGNLGSGNLLVLKK